LQALGSALCSNGTIYLSEIGDLSLPLQDYLVDSYFHARQGISSRLLFGSRRDLLPDVKAFNMREDFYYCISAVTLRISPLRCRKSEILSIADALLTQYSRQFGRPKPTLHEEVVGFLLEHTWPQNLPEFRSAIQTFAAIEDPSISLAALKAAAPIAKSNAYHRPTRLKEAARAASVQIERQMIREVLQLTNGNRKRAAATLGISYKALLYKLKRIGADHASVSGRNGGSR
jgi:DNA-binding NtrC family response regulator